MQAKGMIAEKKNSMWCAFPASTTNPQQSEMSENILEDLFLSLMFGLLLFI